MKKGLLGIVCLLALSLTAIPVGAQTRTRCVDGSRRYQQRYDSRYGTRYGDRVYSGTRYGDRVYSGNRYDGRYDGYGYDNRSVWDRHRDKITTAAGAGAGALLGAAVGGKKGAIIGAIAGGGGAALYTYKLRDKNRYRRPY